MRINRCGRIRSVIYKRLIDVFAVLVRKANKIRTMIMKQIKQILLWMSRAIPDKYYLRIVYRMKMGERLSLNNPRMYTEKIQWLKLNDAKPEYTQWVDKHLVKEYVARIIGEEHIIPTYGVWDRAEDIDFDVLPNQFVLKCNHDSTSVIICRDKESFDKEAACKKLSKCLKNDFFYVGREYPYRDVNRKILAEAYMEDEKLQELRDYKFFTFGGVPKIVHVVSNRQKADEDTYGDFFDMDYKHVNLHMGHDFAPVPPEKPCNFEKMKQFARVLSAGTRHLRVDFYEVNGKLYFGELTFYQDSGWKKIEPTEWNKLLGSWIDLN